MMEDANCDRCIEASIIERKGKAVVGLIADVGVTCASNFDACGRDVDASERMHEWAQRRVTVPDAAANVEDISLPAESLTDDVENVVRLDLSEVIQFEA